MGVRVIRYSERPELWDDTDPVSRAGTVENRRTVAPSKRRGDRRAGCIPATLAPVEIDHGRDLGSYWEPNVWIVHEITTSDEDLANPAI